MDLLNPRLVRFTHASCTKQEVLDTTLGNVLMNVLVKNWRVLDEHFISNYRVIIFDIEGNSGVDMIS